MNGLVMFLSEPVNVFLDFLFCFAGNSKRKEFGSFFFVESFALFSDRFEFTSLHEIQRYEECNLRDQTIVRKRK